MPRSTIDFGIDLGTTNSEIAVLKGTTAEVIKNNENIEFTPSAVWIDKGGHLRVGRAAKERIEDFPEDAYCEFKRDMGTEKRYLFKSSGKTMSPEELSSEVLKSLKSNVRTRLNEEIESAVITVPAAFSLPQIEATRQAAILAGLSSTQCIQEPVAAALAYGFQNSSDKVFWMVFDIGGGTFDAAIVHIVDGTFQVVSHSGDPFLGGKDIDWGIIEKICIPRINKEIGLDGFERGNPLFRSAFAKLKQATEEAKIQLSEVASAPIFTGQLFKDKDYEFNYELTREEVAEIAKPKFLEAIRICKVALGEANLKESNIEKIILVGGPTLAWYAREIISDSVSGLSIPLEFSVDPLTVVAKGAAIYAGTQRIEISSSIPLPDNIFQLELEYEPIGTETDPVIGGKVILPEGKAADSYQIEIFREQWQSGKIKLSPKGTFLTPIFAESGKQNRFTIELVNSSGKKIEVQPNEFIYTVGNATTSQPMIHSMGVALANNDVVRFFDKGQPLPARHIEILKTTISVKRGSSEEMINIPVVEGENLRADRNKLIGKLVIPGDNIQRDVPFGSEVEVTIDVDKNRFVRTKAYISILDEEFEKVLELKNEVISSKELREDVERQQQRMAELQTTINNHSEKSRELDAFKRILKN